MRSSALNTTTAFVSTLRRRLFTRTVGTAFAAALAITGASAIAARAAGGWHHGSAMSAADMDEHIDHMLGAVLAEIDVNDAQKAQITPLVKQAFADLKPLHDTLQPAHDDLIAALSADTIDRDVIENVRIEHMRAADTASQRIAKLIGDVAEILTPAQRKALATHIANHHIEMHG
jgi:Spy/CpxP family protein refolding chaperone